MSYIVSRDSKGLLKQNDRIQGAVGTFFSALDHTRLNLIRHRLRLVIYVGGKIPYVRIFLAIRKSYIIYVCMYISGSTYDM